MSRAWSRQIVERLGNEWYKAGSSPALASVKKRALSAFRDKGMVPTPGKKHPNGALEWSVPTPYSMAMGHNILQVNSFQLARACAVFANGGHLSEADLIRKIVQNEDGNEENSSRQ